jgi:hypothetical protein
MDRALVHYRLKKRRLPAIRPFTQNSVHPHLLLSLVSFTSQLSFAQEPIKFEALVDGSSRMVNAIYSISKQPLKPKSPAVVIMHSTGGDRDGTTQPLAKALNDNGFVTLQIQLFSNPMSAPRFENTNAVYFNALKYLSQREEVDGNKVSVFKWFETNGLVS